ncbi:4,5-DOPA dioxygenase extradiol [Vitreoscilla massiliensis]|uniref:4,5-DOPA dioxygenase extradiol n=1 Tax=Vitreoscilla massiliensis TaxID=1689272 RepID=A0ABY4DZM0_9NEIS|nr:4,5-DOPA dioxygenase extradiol [Vitreoscilla massiliensis]UOO88988.1 4,5-DOPA dioxygenase extradiol [Vitreoscilla massiliensis]
MTNLNQLYAQSRDFSNTDTMPVFFFGHGSPMNAIEANEFTQTWQQIGENLPTPTAILAISAHWLTQGGTAVTAMAQPRTIHDFGGFPQALFEVQYPAAGSPALAHTVIDTVTMTHVHEDMEWGLDHGTWSVLKHVFPQANVPIVQMSIDYSQGADYHYRLGQQLAALRRKGVLIVASGNMVHNLRMVSWQKPVDEAFGFDWALEANDSFKTMLNQRNHNSLIDWQNQGEAFRLAIPTPDHYYPMMYSMGLQESSDELTFFNDKAVMGSLTMTSYRLDAKV